MLKLLVSTLLLLSLTTYSQSTIVKPENFEKALKEFQTRGTGNLTFQSGTYYFSKSLKLKNLNNSRIQATNGSKVKIISGVPLKKRSFLKTIPAELNLRLRTEVRNKVVAVDLKRIGIRKINKWPDLLSGRGNMVELLYRSKRLQLARWPNHKPATMNKVVDNGQQQPKNRGGSFNYGAENHQNWPLEKGVWLRGYWRVPWVLQTLRIKNIDKKK
jgi:hypothetical protein